MNKAELEQHIRRGIPLAAHMDFRVRELTDHSISVNGGAAENLNVHHTVFAGSLYALCTLAVWGLVYSRLPQNAELVLAEGSIRYRKPVVGEIAVDCEIEADTINRFLDNLQRRGKGRLKATAAVNTGEGIAVEFSGLLYARLESD